MDKMIKEVEKDDTSKSISCEVSSDVVPWLLAFPVLELVFATLTPLSAASP